LERGESPEAPTFASTRQVRGRKKEEKGELKKKEKGAPSSHNIIFIPLSDSRQKRKKRKKKEENEGH